VVALSKFAGACNVGYGAKRGIGKRHHFANFETPPALDFGATVNQNPLPDECRMHAAIPKGTAPRARRSEARLGPHASLNQLEMF
jgi:hypothetical protein